MPDYFQSKTQKNLKPNETKQQNKKSTPVSTEIAIDHQKVLKTEQLSLYLHHDSSKRPEIRPTKIYVKWILYA